MKKSIYFCFFWGCKFWGASFFWLASVVFCELLAVCKLWASCKLLILGKLWTFSILLQAAFPPRTQVMGAMPPQKSHFGNNSKTFLRFFTPIIPKTAHLRNNRGGKRRIWGTIHPRKANFNFVILKFNLVIFAKMTKLNEGGGVREDTFFSKVLAFLCNIG